jgi:predicted TIM-barrel fold metal-dependent hydrolase
MVIDGHVHVTQKGWAVFNPEQMRSEGVDCALAFTGEWLAACKTLDALRRSNEHLAQLRDSNAGALIPFATTHPKFGTEGAEELLRAIRDRGMAGVAFNPHQQSEGAWVGDFNLLTELGHGPIVEVLRELKAPVLFDCDYLAFYSSPAQLAELARRLPDSPIIMGHFGWMNMWPMCIDVATKQDNLFMGTSAAPPMAIRQAVCRVGAGRVIFGSDFPCDRPLTVQYELRKVRELGLPDSQEEAILGANLLKLGVRPQSL